MTRLWLLATLLPVAMSAGSGGGRAQAPDDTSESRKAAEQLVDSLELESLQGDKWVKAKRIDRPLLSYTDDTRGDDRGFLWGWADKGRPLAVFEIFQKVHNRAIWTVCICNTSGGRLRAARAGSPGGWRTIRTSRSRMCPRRQRSLPIPACGSGR
jgi:hypothetical protein